VLRVTLVDQDRPADDLHDVDPGQLRERVGDREAILGAVRVDAQLDQLVIGDGLLDLLEHGGRRPTLPDLHDGRQMMSVPAQRAAELARRHEGLLLGIACRDHRLRLSRRRIVAPAGRRERWQNAAMSEKPHKRFAHDGIEPLAPNLWSVRGRLPFPLMRYMAIHRLADGTLLLHSVIAMSDEGMLAYEVDLEGGGKALVMSDAVANADHPKGFGGWFFQNVTGGIKGRLGVARIMKVMMVKNKAEARAGLERLADIPGLTLLSVAPGRPVRHDVGGALREAAAAL
jgi:hypothetical protein